MTGTSRRLSFMFAVAIANTFAGCGGPQQSLAPLPIGAVSHLASRPLPRSAQSGQPLLYLSDEWVEGGSIYLYPLTGPSKRRIGSISKGIREPFGLCVDANNSLYVANSYNGTVTVYPYGSSSPSMTYSKGVQNPLYPLADSAGHVFVSGYAVSGDRKRGEVFEYNAGANVPIAHTRIGSEADGMAADPSGNLYVTYRTKKHLLNGPGYIAEFGPGLRNERSLSVKLLHAPQGLLVDSAGNLLVAETASGVGTISVFPPGAKAPSMTLALPKGDAGQLAMQNSETTLWVSSEIGFSYAYVYSMPYPLTASTHPVQYEFLQGDSHGIAVSPQ